MGCNTSKESVQPAAEEAKEDVKNGDIPKTTESGTSDVSSKESRQTEQKEEDKTTDKEEVAATRIQAAFRGHHARKSMKDTETSTKQSESKSDSEPTLEQLQEEFRSDDKELSDAATKIQASFRGHMSRKEGAIGAVAKTAEDFVENAANKIEKTMDDAVNELEGIDLSDPDLHKAATKIQASFRGHKVRQEVPISGTEEKK
ncbi:neuromodulin [Belonocnema kinseyi]|uniref:neuromodulin n=1 Tax=Belonocnema kinseyi TaxID=2817044 RepID=UPI00143DE2FF|nr:neuromodulin [Belonocnema kinseyi]